MGAMKAKLDKIAAKRIAVFADVHADLPALESVVDAVEAAGISRMWCLGDFASGGAHPQECFDLVMSRCEHVLAGNHELFITREVFGRLQGGWADDAYAAYLALGEERLVRLRRLRSRLMLTSIELVHASLLDPELGEIRTEANALANMRYFRRPLLIYSHTHQAAFFVGKDAGSPEEHAITVGKSYELPRVRRDGVRSLVPCAMNPGAVCDEHGARWLELDLSEEPSVTWHQESPV